MVKGRRETCVMREHYLCEGRGDPARVPRAPIETRRPSDP